MCWRRYGEVSSARRLATGSRLVSNHSTPASEPSHSACGAGLAVLLVAVLGVYTSSALFDSGNFADRATSSFEEPEVQRVVGERVSDEVTKAAPNAVAGKPLIEAVVEGVAGHAGVPVARAGRGEGSAPDDLRR